MKIENGSVEDRLRRVPADDVRRERGCENNRRRFASDAGDSEQRAGDDPAQRRRNDNLDDGLPFAGTESGTCIPERDRYEPKYLLGRAGDQWHLDYRECNSRDPGRLTVPDDEQAEDEDADHNRRHAVEDVQHEPDELAHAVAGKLACEQRYENPDRYCDRVASATMINEPTIAFATPAP